ncbi:MAG TPA: hypothetical protein VGM91_09625 [Conexibacter sp.]|jgi:hypothetical protein
MTSAIDAYDDHRATADALLAREYDELKPAVVKTVAAKLAAAGVRLPEADLDAFYNQAWHGLHTMLATGEQVDNRTAMLVTIAFRRAIDEHRALQAARRADVEQLDEIAVEPDVDARLDDATRLRQFVGGLRQTLDRRELEAAALCYVYELSRPEAARLIGVRPRRMEKIMDGVSRKLAPMIGEIRNDEWCEANHSLVKAYALGLLDEEGERYRLARDHLADCSACRRTVLRTRGIATVVPPIPLAFAALAAVGVGAGAGVAAGGTAGAGVGAGTASAGASPLGAAAGRGAAHGGAAHGASHGASLRAKIAVGGAVTVAVAAAVAIAATLLGGGGGHSSTATQSIQAARLQAAEQARAAARARAQAEAAARARATARARSDAAARRAHARQLAAVRRNAATPEHPIETKANAVTVTTTPPPAPPVEQQQPTTPPPAPPVQQQPPATPPPASAPAKRPTVPSRQPPVRDGAEEFDLH